MLLTVEERKARIASVFDRVADDYDTAGVDYFKPLGRDLVVATGVAPGDRVLDVGCGRGACLFSAAEAAGPAGEVIGVDLSPNMVARTNADIALRGIGNARALQGDAEALDFAPESFDAVVSGMAMFFLPDPAAVLRDLHDLLRPGGRIGFSSFSGDDERWEVLHRAVAPYLPPGVELRRHVAPPDHPFHLTSTLTRMLIDAGFADARHVHEPFTARFRDPQHWWDWSWANGQRAMLQRIPVEQLAAAREAALAALSTLCEPDGSLELRVVARFSLGRRRA